MNRRHGSCRGSWDTKCTEDTDICLVNNFHAICRGGSYWEADVEDPVLMSSYTPFGVACRYNSLNSVAHWGVLTVRVKPLRSRRKFLFCSVFTAQGQKPEVKICVSPARNVGWVNFLVSRCSAVAVFVHLVVTPRESTWYGHKTCLGRSNLRFACAGPQTRRVSAGQNLRFACRRATKNASRQVKMCVSLRETLQRISIGVFSLRRATKNARRVDFVQDRHVWMLRYGSWRGSTDKDAETWILIHGSCSGSV